MFSRARMIVGSALALGASLVPHFSHAFSGAGTERMPHALSGIGIPRMRQHVGKRYSRNTVAMDKRAAAKRRNQQRHKRLCRVGG